jgi:starvation-inducible DNA-binding protein
MKMLQNNEILDEKTTKQLVSQLQPTLTDLIALGLITKQAHWNVRGPGFRSIHLHLDEIYDAIQEDVDTVAERISTLNVSPDGQADHVTKNTILTSIPSGFLKDQDVVDLMVDRVSQTCQGIRERMAKVEDPDTVTADMLHQVLAGLEKHLWMLRSSRA